jgi:hypothetical protein
LECESGNPRYSADDIDDPGVWAAFNLNAIQQHYGALLATAQITDEPFPTSIPQVVIPRQLFDPGLTFTSSREYERGLRCGFAHLTQTNQLGYRNYIPDTAYFDPTLLIGNFRH